MTSKPPVAGALLRAVCVAWIGVLLVMLGFGVLSRESRGAVTWGQTSDIFAMSVAISELKYGLKGGIGYHEVEAALTSQMTTTHSSIAVNDEGTRALASRTDITDSALRAATSLDASKFITGGKAENGSYVTMGAEDIGLAHFYKWAFRLFGYNAFSTRRLYVTFLAASCVLFVAVFWRSSAALAMLNAAVTAIFVATTTDIFHALLPSVAANRFLSTLAIVPMLHLVCAAIGLCVLTPGAVIVLFAQVWMMAAAISARSSGNWTVLAFLIVVAGLLVARRKSDRMVSAVDEFVTWARSRPIAVQTVAKGLQRHTVLVAVVFVLTYGAFGVVRDLSLDPAYSGEGISGKHLVWHNAYIALALNPEWPSVKPYPAQNNVLSDNISWVAFGAVAAKEGFNPLHPAGIYRIKVLDQVIRDEYLKFALRHPVFMFELFTIYKPKGYYEVAAGPVRSVPRRVRLMMLLSAALGGLLLSFDGARRSMPQLFLASIVVVLLAQAPVIWTYPARHVFADQLWSLLFAAIVFPSFAIAMGVRLLGLTHE